MSFPLHPRGSHGCSPTTTHNEPPILPLLLLHTELSGHCASTSYPPPVFQEQFSFQNWAVPEPALPPIDGACNRCAAWATCLAPQGADLFSSTHRCWGCRLREHSSILCGKSLGLLLIDHPCLVGPPLPRY
jgi:hypothetical protein